jgi:hypothetical protein
MEIQKQKIARWLCGALLILVVPNILCWVIQTRVFMSRGIFVLEYLVLACFYPIISRKLFLVLWAVFALYDIFFASSSMLFMDFFEIIHALTKFPNLSTGDWLKWAALLIVFIAITLGLFNLLERYNRVYPFLRVKFLWPLIVGLLVVDFFNGQGATEKSVKLYDINANIVSTPVMTFCVAARNVMLSPKAQKEKVEYLGSLAHTVFAQQPDSAICKKEVLVLVESWGLIKDSALQHEILLPVYQMKANSWYRLREGHTRYKYLTQAGEYREITGYLFHSYQLQQDWVKQKSIFIKKQQEGFRVIGLHGNTSLFYRRNEYWPAMGIHESWFAEDFRRSGMALCGNVLFRGICDTSLNTWLLNKMSSQPDRKEFYYWVTLTTHLPLVEIHDDDYRLFAEKWKKAGVSEDVLQLAYQHRLLFKDLADKLSKPGSPKAHILLVGDHAPPFIDVAEHNMYDEKLVPYIELIPK